MKAFSLVSLWTAAIFLWGYIFGAGLLPLHQDFFTGRKVLTRPMMVKPVTQINSPTIQVDSIEYAQIQIVPDAPVVSNQSQVWPVQEIIGPQTGFVEEPAVTPADLSPWMIPLDQTLPGVPSPYNAMPGPVANILPAIPGPEYEQMTLDQAWDTAVAIGISDHFPPCIYPLPTPYIDWQMSIELSQLQTADRTYDEIKMQASDIAAIAMRGGGYFPTAGIIQIPESFVKTLGLPLYSDGSIQICRDPNNRPAGYGAGIQTFLDT